MKVSGFTIVRNAVKFDYPVVESIQSILPVCDEMIVAVGNSDDGTLELIRSINSPKIKIIETVWDDTLREGGRVLAVETDKAFAQVSPDSDWAFYIQADEVCHEADLPKIKAAMEKYADDKNAEGLLFGYRHFYGSYDYVADSLKWYKNEIRIVRNDKNISSWKDAISFRKGGQKLHVRPTGAFIYHYGWVKDPRTQKEKRKEFDKMWHDDRWISSHHDAAESEFDYSKIDTLAHFTGKHPAVMTERIKKMNWKFSFDPTRSVKTPLKYRLRTWFNGLTGLSVGVYRNYREL